MTTAWQQKHPRKQKVILGFILQFLGESIPSYPVPGEDGVECGLCLQFLPPHTIALSTIHSHSSSQCQRKQGEGGQWEDPLENRPVEVSQIFSSSNV